MNVKYAALVDDFYHPGERVAAALEMLQSHIEGSIEVFSHPGEVPWGELKTYDGFLLCRDGRMVVNGVRSDETWLGDEIDQSIEAFVESGGLLVVLHSGLADLPVGSNVRRMCKGVFQYHPEGHPGQRISAVKAASALDLTKGLDPFFIHDEQYMIEWENDGTTLLLESLSEEHGRSPAAWTHSLGGGQVLCITPGHTEEALQHPELHKFIARAVKILTRR